MHPVGRDYGSCVLEPPNARYGISKPQLRNVMTFTMKLASWTLTPALSIGVAVRIALGQNNVGREK
jgi:hypothetical protein